MCSREGLRRANERFGDQSRGDARREQFVAAMRAPRWRVDELVPPPLQIHPFHDRQKTGTEAVEPQLSPVVFCILLRLERREQNDR